MQTDRQTNLIRASIDGSEVKAPAATTGDLSSILRT